MTAKTETRILVACIGNIFLGDDAFGVEMARRLQCVNLLSEAMVVDFGIRSIDLSYALLEPWRAVIIIDAISRGGAPGSLYLLEVEKDGNESVAPDPHSIDAVQVLALSRSLGEITTPIYVLGCEPALLDVNFDCASGLSSSVSAALPEGIRMLEEWIQSLTSPAVMSRGVGTAASQ
jgi:hydrogenase maturation protease